VDLVSILVAEETDRGTEKYQKEEILLWILKLHWKNYILEIL